ncbi:MAG: 50S ribosomal protein L6 [Firmicutes bacterium]|nr:50S ribosomal protein L6 [Bacillota bacterium]
MSRIGRAPIKLGKGVSVSFEGGLVTAKGPLGTLTQPVQNRNINVEIEGETVLVKRLSEAKEVKAAHGLYRALIQNMATGVEKGFERRLMISGVGWKAVAQGEKIVLSVGFSHPVELVPVKGIKLEVISPTEVAVKGIDKVLVGQFAADIKAVRKPEPYHGYGIRYKEETILRKEGKKAGK